MSMDREGVQWTDAQQRAGFLLALRTVLVLALLLVAACVARGLLS